MTFEVTDMNFELLFKHFISLDDFVSFACKKRYVLFCITGCLQLLGVQLCIVGNPWMIPIVMNCL